MNRKKDHTAPVAVVTGAARGIGRALLIELHSRGYKVIAVVRSLYDVEELALIDHEFILPICCDITDADAELLLRQFLEAHVNRVDLLINNAGVDAAGKGINGLSFQELDLNLSVHCYGTLRCVRACLPFLRASSRALIVSMSSCHASLELIASGQIVHDEVTHSYKIAQGAANMISAVLAAELRSENIRVLSFDPGPVKTRLGPPNAKTLPEEVARAIIDLAENSGDTGIFLHMSKGKMPW